MRSTAPGRKISGRVHWSGPVKQKGRGEQRFGPIRAFVVTSR